MKANELMIGDIVEWCGEYHTIGSLDQSEDGRWWYYSKEHQAECTLDDAKPIPLTSEILEKNFVNERRNGYISWIKDEYCETCFDIEMLINSTIIEKQFEYVHKLQHALRICGIEKEIVI